MTNGSLRSDALETYHPLQPSDATVVAGMREALAPIKGTIDSPAARPIFDEVMEHTPDATDVSFEKGAVGGVQGVWCLPASRRDGAYILYCLSPGTVDTPSLRSAFGKASDEDKVEATIKSIEDRSPAGRMGSASEIGAATAFLASDAASYIKSVELFADGGLRAA